MAHNFGDSGGGGSLRGLFSLIFGHGCGFGVDSNFDGGLNCRGGNGVVGGGHGGVRCGLDESPLVLE
jgi:hypothetical protein